MADPNAHRLWIQEALNLQLSTPDDRTLGQRLYDALRSGIQQGQLSTGHALPSSRQLAASLGIGRNTVLGAIDRLVAEGFLVSRQGAGVFVAEWQWDPQARKVADHTAPVALSRRGERLLDFSASSSERHLAFAPGVPALDRFPRERWQRLLRRHQQRAPIDWFDYQNAGGVSSLRDALCDYLQLSRSVRCRPEQILITQGAQQGFELIARLLADVGDSVLMEEPGYGGAQACFASAGLTLQTVEVDEDGMNVASLAAETPSPKLIYLTPSHQYPRGATLPLSRRTALLAIAQQHGAWIIEDDYDSEFRYSSAPIASLQGLMDDAPVIYVGTFSKVLYPGLRLGYLVLPPSLVDSFRRINARLHREGQYVAQAALADFISEGHFSRHVARMRKCYRSRQAALRRALAPAVARGLELSSGHAGMHLVAYLESHEMERELVRQGNEAGLRLSALSGYYWRKPGQPGLVLGYAGANENDIDRAGRWLSDAWLSIAREVTKEKTPYEHRKGKNAGG
ncbi:PLP-dependent aminotransferase family protein [Halomonas urumqiensis]|uniref:PLP-dependent aminotransferase family protein n=1 Tax=Halomonas urumqiensis TaxID=1684789 RepID=A0A2N7UD83_9GAMM|nr:PLP-dependent aminotransferase family protein [Halomonas urumqiensis]PMR78393.1 PLP-dependent aminotransferase family protein [Halomonas urumqiensis]PTB03539.1 PLP-dependent aminotransferase family protein [Halomonas urumqiensis]GHE20261.1 GntR family transcriptional regulator [Halomonas urumqiensis]